MKNKSLKLIFVSLMILFIGIALTAQTAEAKDFAVRNETGGNAYFFISGSNGRVGIGDIALNKAFNVLGGGNFTGNVTSQTDFCIPGVGCLRDVISSQIGGSGTANYVPLWSDNETLTDSNIYQDSSGNLGIGTETPETEIDMAKGSISNVDSLDWDIQEVGGSRVETWDSESWGTWSTSSASVKSDPTWINSYEGSVLEITSGGYAESPSINLDNWDWSSGRIYLDFWAAFRGAENYKHKIQFSNDGGSTWTTLETISSPDLNGVSNWHHLSYDVTALAEHGGDHRIRFDSASPSLPMDQVAIDNVRMVHAPSLGRWLGSDNEGDIAYTGGAVGIGTDSPQDTLDVNGSASVSGNVTSQTDFCIEGGSCLSGAGEGTGTMSNWTIAGDSGSSVVSDGETVTIAGGSGISTSESSRTVTVTANDINATNELQDLSSSRSGDTVTINITDGTGTSFTDNYESDTNFTGEAAGGELTGTYPNPSIVDDALDDQYITVEEESSLNVNSSDYWDNLDTPADITGLGDSNIDSLSWTKLKNYPTGCGAGEAVQVINDTLTCVDIAGESAITGSGSTGQAAFWTGTDTLDGDNNFTWDNTNKRLGIGTDNPGEKLDVVGNLQLTDNTLSPTSVTFDSETSTGLRLTNPNGYVSLTPLNSGWAHIYTDRSDFIFNKPVYTTANRFSSYSTGDLQLQTGGTTRMTILNSDGSVGIGTTSPGQKLEVNGTAGYESTGDMGSEATAFASKDYVDNNDNAGTDDQTLSYTNVDDPSVSDHVTHNISIENGNTISIRDYYDVNTDSQDLSSTLNTTPTVGYVTHDIHISGGSDTSVRDYYEPDTTADEYGSWTISDGGSSSPVSSGQTVTMSGGDGITTTESTRTVTIDTDAPSCGTGEYSYWDGSSWNCRTDDTGSGDQNLFETIDTSSGTNPVADSPTDTLSITGGTKISVTGDSGTDTVTIDNDYGSAINDEEMASEDFGEFTCDGTEDGCTLNSGVYDDEYIELGDSFGGEVSGTYDSITLDNGALDDQYITEDASDTMDAGTSTSLTILSNDDGQSTLNLYGASQGTGYVYVGQDSQHGGGITYNGDGTPSTGTTSDDISIFRRSNSNNYEVLHWSHNSDTAQFEGNIDMNTNSITGVSGISGCGGNADDFWKADGSGCTDVDDAVDDIWVNENGDTMTGTLTMSGEDIDWGSYEITEGSNVPTGLSVRAISNPPSDDPIFAVESSGGATRFGVTQGNGGWFRNGLRVGYTYDAGGIPSNADNLYVNGAVYAGAFYYSSDEALKKNITTLDNSLEKIKQINGTSFKWKDENKTDPQIGLIAQDVEKVFPEAVKEGGDGFKRIQAGNLIAPLIESVKELDAKDLQLDKRMDKQDKRIDKQAEKIKEQDKKIKEQEKRINELEKDIDEIKKLLEERNQTPKNKTDDQTKEKEGQESKEPSKETFSYKDINLFDLMNKQK